MPKTSIAADAAGALGLLAVLATILGPAGIHAGLFSPMRGFIISWFGVLPCALLALLFGIAGLLRTRPGSGRSGRGRAWLGVGVGVALLVLMGSWAFRLRRAPPIHDVTTNPAAAPVFSDAVRSLRAHLNGVDYPDGGVSVPDLQKVAYPDLSPIRLDETPEAALDRARRAAEALGWRLTRVDPTEGRVEAYDVSSVFMLVDDVVVRVSRAEAGSVVDVRSSSRVGRSDMGRNALRIRAFRAILMRR